MKSFYVISGGVTDHPGRLLGGAENAVMAGRGLPFSGNDNEIVYLIGTTYRAFCCLLHNLPSNAGDECNATIY